MTQKEVYDQLWFEIYMKYNWHFMNPNAPSFEELERKASIYAVQNTWYWFNNQEEFKNNCVYFSRDKA